MDKTYIVMIVFAAIFGLALGVQPFINVENTNKIITKIDNQTALALETINKTHNQVDIIFGLIGINESNIEDIEKILNLTNNDTEMFDTIHNNLTFMP
jgi:hypothetical protein